MLCTHTHSATWKYLSKRRKKSIKQVANIWSCAIICGRLILFYDMTRRTETVKKRFFSLNECAFLNEEAQWIEGFLFLLLI